MKKEIEPMLLKHKIIPTAMRMLVLDHLTEVSSAVSLSELERALAPADRVTIYRTLKTFESNGLVHKIDDGSGTAKYACCSNQCSPQGHKDVHVHFICNQCSETYCLADTGIPDLVMPDGFRAVDVNLLVRGACNRCSA